MKIRKMFLWISNRFFLLISFGGKKLNTYLINIEIWHNIDFNSCGNNNPFSDGKNKILRVKPI